MSGEHETPAAVPTPGRMPAGAPGSDVDLRDMVALVVGALVGLLVAALDIAVWWAVDSARIGGAMSTAILWGVPFAVLVLIVCGAITRRFRLWLVVVGGFLFASPLIGLGISLLIG